LYDDFSSSPLVVDGVVYVGGVDGSACFYAINAQTGEEKWSFTPMMGDFVYSSPALLDDTVYFGGSEGLYALDIQTGEEKWLFETESTVQSPAIGDDGTIYFGSKDPALYAVDAQTGELKWKNDELSTPQGGRGTCLLLPLSPMGWFMRRSQTPLQAESSDSSSQYGLIRGIGMEVPLQRI
jgi:outer membrane protein assembly factor BamB